ncbi:MAG: serine hydrolase [candidate division KSB1 bacterium]|jgi:CubicO group peptidase (beta-lactamase class C family)|nr:serine hydrolase [candidate division KSB1 bacterium]
MKKILTFLFLLFFTTTALSSGNQSIADNPEVAGEIHLMEKWINSQIDFHHLPGIAVGVVYDQQLIYSKGFGYADLEYKIPATPSTIYRIASITKTFTSTAIMQLRDAGRLRLDDPVSTFLPWFKIQNKFKDSPPVTIRQLLTHTSGLPREAAFPYWTDHKFPTREQIMQSLPDQQMIFESETKYKYSNLGIALLGAVVEAASGESYESYISRHILQPLKMENTSVSLPDWTVKNRAKSYSRLLKDGTREEIPVSDTKGIAPAANISTTVMDLAKFAAFQLSDGVSDGKIVLKKSTLREMHRVHWLYPDWSGGRGLGFSVSRLNGRTIVGHGGWVEGFRTRLSFCPEEKIAVVVMTNSDDSNPTFFAHRIYELLAPAILNVTKPGAEKRVADPSWTAYTGKYEDPWHWEYEVMILNDRLVLYGSEYPPEDNPESALTELIPESEHTFRMKGNGELLIFEMGNDGKVARIRKGVNYIYPVKTE